MDRQELLRDVGPGGMGARSGGAQAARAIASGAAQRPWHEPGRGPESLLDPARLFSLGSVWQGEVDLGECLDTVSQVEPGDARSWSREWTRIAERVRQGAQRAEAKGHLISAGEAWLRASTYYRAALYRHPEPRGPDEVRLARHVLVGFTRSLRLLGAPAQPVLIPYERTPLPGYFFRSPVARAPAPVLIIHPGRDGWAEDCKALAEAAIKRGQHCLLFDGPGQGKALRLQGLALRPDWEKVITPVVDWVLRQQGVEPSRIALLEASKGGALAARAAAFEKRLKLCISSPGASTWAEVVHEALFGQEPQPSEASPGLGQVGTLSVASQRVFDWLDEHL